MSYHGELSRIGIAAAASKAEGPAMGVGVRVPRSPPKNCDINTVQHYRSIKMRIQEIISEAPANKITIKVTMVPEDEHNFMDAMKEFPKLKATTPVRGEGRKMESSVTGDKRDLFRYLSSDDGPGYSLEFIKKNYPEVLSK
jgi:hypothetical protein